MERAKLIPIRLYLAYRNLRDEESGQAMVEYALILALVSVVAIAILTTLGGTINSVFTKVNSDLKNVP